MKVWIDQDLCTGDGLCEEIAPSVFQLLDDGLAYVKAEGQVDARGPDGQPANLGIGGMVTVAAGLETGNLEAAVREAADECPGECIFIEEGL